MQLIRNDTSPDQRRYVESGSNPADEASRGMNAKEIMQKSQWINVLSWQTEDHWPQQDSYENEVDHISPDVRKVTANETVIEQHEKMLSRFERFSKWQVLTEPWVWKSPGHFLYGLETLNKQKQKLSSSSKRIISIKKSRLWKISKPRPKVCLKIVGKVKKAILKKSSSLNALDPCLGASGLLRVREQIKKANLPDNLKNPVILPKSGHTTELVLRQAHEKTHHSGRGVTVNELRSNAWLVDYQWECCSRTFYIKVCHVLISPWYFWRTENDQSSKFQR